MLSKEDQFELTEKILSFLQDRRNAKEETFLKSKAKKNKQGQITNGAINERLVLLLKKDQIDKDKILEIEKSKKQKDQSTINFQREKFSKLSEIASDLDDKNDYLDLVAEYQDFKESNNHEHKPDIWLTNWCIKAKDISFASHVGKLTHSSSKSTSILDSTQKTNSRYLTTNSLSETMIDTASSNAASIPVAELLKITIDNGTSVLDCIKNNDDVFNQFTDDELLKDSWYENLKQAYDSKQKQSYFLSKQVYFPIETNKYHLLLPLKSSSLIQRLHLEHKKYFEDEQKHARDQKKNKKYSKYIQCSYPNKAFINVTASNHSNASTLNGQRGGRILLLPTSPPVWNSNSTERCSSSDIKNILNKRLAYILKDEILELGNYLSLLKDKNLSINEPNRNANILNKLSSIIDSFFNHFHQAGDYETNKQWINNFSQEMGRWLNKQLNKNLKEKKKTPFDTKHSALWSLVFKNSLKEYIAIQEVKL